RHLRLEVADNHVVFIANQSQDFCRGRADLLRRRRWRGAAELILGEQEYADNAGERRRQDIQDELANKPRQQWKFEMTRTIARRQVSPKAISLHRQPPRLLQMPFFQTSG